MPKPCMPRNVASMSGIDPAKLKPIPFILDSSVPECHRQPDNVQEMGDKEQKTKKKVRSALSSNVLLLLYDWRMTS